MADLAYLLEMTFRCEKAKFVDLAHCWRLPYTEIVAHQINSIGQTILPIHCPCIYNISLFFRSPHKSEAMCCGTRNFCMFQVYQLVRVPSNTHGTCVEIFYFYILYVLDGTPTNWCIQNIQNYSGCATCTTPESAIYKLQCMIQGHRRWLTLPLFVLSSMTDPIFHLSFKKIGRNKIIPSVGGV